MDREIIHSEVSGVGLQVDLLQAALQELRTGISVLQSQNNQIVEEAIIMFQGYQSEMESIRKRILNNTLSALALEWMNARIYNGLKILNSRFGNIYQILASVTKSLKEVPSCREHRQQTSICENQVSQIYQINTGTTTTLEVYK